MASFADTVKVKPSTATEYIELCLKAGLTPFLQGNPGIGKSEIVKSIAKKFNLKLIDHRLSTSDIVDLNGMPVFKDKIIKKQDKEYTKKIATFVPFDIFPTEQDKVPDGYDGWLLFFDELNSASEDVQAACYKIILDKMVGQYKLHPRCVIVAAGNEETDGAITKRLSTAMVSRLVHLHMTVDFDDWMENVALARNYDPRIIAYLNYNHEALMDFDPQNEDKIGDTFCCPRSWSFVNNILKAYGETDNLSPLTSLLQGTISEGQALSFISFCSLADKTTPYEEIIADPLRAKVPVNMEQKWFTIVSLLQKTNLDDLDLIDKYISRFEDMSFDILYWKALKNKRPEVLSNKTFNKKMIEITSYLSQKEKVFNTGAV